MKTLKFRRNLSREILAGKKTSTWRLFDDKDIKADDEVEMLVWETMEKFASAKITGVRVKRLDEILETDFGGHEKYASREEMLREYRKYYGDKVDWNTVVKMIDFKILT